MCFVVTPDWFSMEFFYWCSRCLYWFLKYNREFAICTLGLMKRHKCIRIHQEASLLCRHTMIIYCGILLLAYIRSRCPWNATIGVYVLPMEFFYWRIIRSRCPSALQITNWRNQLLASQWVTTRHNWHIEYLPFMFFCHDRVSYMYLHLCAQSSRIMLTILCLIRLTLVIW